jgi:type IV pilus assembly protein PilB
MADLFNDKLARAFGLRNIPPEDLRPPEGGLLSDALLQAGKVDATTVNQVLSEVTGLRSVDPTMVSFTPDFIEHAVALVPMDVAFREKVFPIRHEANHVHLVMARPEDLDAVYRLEYVTGSRIAPYVCNSRAIIEAIRTHYGQAATEKLDPHDVPSLLQAAVKAVNQLRMALAEPMALINNVRVIQLLRAVLNDLVHKGASDLHFEPREEGFVVRYRKDGVMVVAWEFPSLIRQVLIDRLKLISGLDLTVTGTPQDGSIDYHIVEGRDIDVRVNSLPSLYGEKLVLRILDKGAGRLNLDVLGLEPEDRQRMELAVHRPNGLVLVTGPTGSGKSTTLYAVLQELNTPEVNIVTAEDPVEYKLNGLTQVNCSGGLGFGQVIRSFLRQDPDIIMVGEIRDAETADFAVKAAMTGHLVLSTLHTNDAAGTINRLVNMGLPPFLVASAQITVVAQRLLRRICQECKAPYEPDPAELARVPELKDQDLVFYRGVGCDRCNGTGFSGRVGIYEIMPVSERMEKMILENEPASRLKQAALEEGMRTLRQAALHKVRLGLSTVGEVLRVTLDAT